VFDVAERVLLVDFDGEEGDRRRTERLGSTVLHERARRLADWGVDVLVCGAISRPLEMLLSASGIRVIALICGDVERVLRALRDGTLDEEEFAMPGCCRKRQQARLRRRHRSGGPIAEETS
jgi:predicted Fe-Mo cluster-binding NifX family protein